jgi:tetratricopeptide (TPR) repeat protein
MTGSQMSRMALNVSQDLRRTLDELGDAFLQEFLEIEVARHPANVEALAELGQIYTTRGMWDAGLEIDERLVRLVPTSPTAHYNLACSRALLGDSSAALEALEQAVGLGYSDCEFMAQDDDLASLRDSRRFRALIERIRTGS